MRDNESFEYILVGPDGQVVTGACPLLDGKIHGEMTFPTKEGPLPLTAHYVRTPHTVDGRIRFDWTDTVFEDTTLFFRLASVDGLGNHGLENDFE